MCRRKEINYVRELANAMEMYGSVAKRYWAERVARRQSAAEMPFFTGSPECQASRWIARLNADDVSPDDCARFEIWRRLHPRNARAYDELAATWRELTARESIDNRRCATQPQQHEDDASWVGH